MKVTGYSHKYNKFKIGFNRYVADATWNCDLERVKFGKTTKCYYSLNITRDLNDKKIEDIDKKIGYIEEEYFDTKLERIIDSFECEYEDKKVSELDYLLAKISKIKEIYDEVNTFKYFSDAFYCQEHLLDKFFKGSSYKFHNNNLYSFTEDGGCDLINILDVEYNGEKFNYVLKPVDGKYEFYEIPLSEGEHYKNELRMS